MNGYEEAKTIDSKVEKLLEENPISDAKNAREWLRFARTISTTMNILEEKAEDAIDKETELICKKKAELCSRPK